MLLLLKTYTNLNQHDAKWLYYVPTAILLLNLFVFFYVSPCTMQHGDPRRGGLVMLQRHWASAKPLKRFKQTVRSSGLALKA